MKLNLLESLELYCKTSDNKNTIEEITAYIKTKDQQGFLDVEFGQGECLVFLKKDISQTGYFSSKKEIVEFLQDENFEYEEIYFIKREIQENINFSII